MCEKRMEFMDRMKNDTMLFFFWGFEKKNREKMGCFLSQDTKRNDEIGTSQMFMVNYLS